ncbi:MAG: ABC transporter permease [Candidatus Nanopelagicales bacterium]
MSTVVDQLVTHRATVGLMVRQDLKSYYGRYRLGLLWTMGDPFLQSMFMWAVFTLIFHSTKGIAQQPFIIYVITGLLPLGWLTTSIGGGTKILRRYGDLMVTSKVPTVVWPMRLVLFALADMVLAFPVVVALAVVFHLFTGEPMVTWGIILVPVALFFQFFLCLGFAMIGAAMSVHFPDVERMTSLLNRFFFWMSPVLWSQRNFPDWITPYLYLNPFHGILDCYRATFFPDVLSQWQNYVISFSVTMGIFATGVVLMRSRTGEIRRLF